MPEQERRDQTLLQEVLKIGKDVSDIKVSLAVNTTETKNINGRLDKLNGSIYAHEASISSLKENVAINTRVIDQIQKKEDGKDQKEERDQEKKADRLRRWTDKAIWAALGVAGIFIIRLLALLANTGHLKDIIK